ncbi:hypothetical protein Brsp07_03432 [Brucella sp. NBRC 14130]|uniref:hypothetical protein n=1 Tax=Brucella sp. NBRC 14130 TaxID=3075483 RepID=UPI00309B058F
MASELKPCGGCGATSDRERCIGCLHDFGTPESAWVRPTPVAPVSPDANGKCGELVTVAWFQPSQRCCDNGWMEAMAWQEGEFSAPVVLRSQAEELLASEIRRERDLAAKQLSEVVDRMSDDYLALKAELDQAVGVIEDRSSEYEALEAKLAAAEKALEPFVSFFNEAMKGFTEGYAERTPSDKPVLGWNNAYLLMQHFIEARATLGGKPS